MKDRRGRIADIERAIASSEECGARPGARPVFWSGNPYAPAMLVGEAPGESEEREGKPFVGRAGRLLRRILQDCGVDLERDIYITNIVPFRPVSPGPAGRVRNRPPTSRQIEACRPFLELEIHVVNPRLIIPLGVNAARWFLGRSFDLGTGRGRLYKWRDTSVFPTYHPAAAMRPFGPAGALRRKFFETDITEAAAMIKTLEREEKAG